MVIPRYQLLPEGQNAQIHCISRCIRRAFPRGSDPYSNKNSERKNPSQNVFSLIILWHISGFARHLAIWSFVRNVF